jgi:SanA protein
MKRTLALIVVAVVAIPLLVRGWTMLTTRSRIYRALTQVPSHEVAIVFGAGVRNGQPTAMLFDRVASAVALYKAGVAQKLLMSGDGRFKYRNEPAAMRRIALQMGVPDADIMLDDAGRSTYDTCYRARDIFGLESAVLVTQDFHLDRALLTCNALGLDAVGYAADRRQYRSIWWNELREIPATVNALLELFLTKPQP